MPKEHRKRGQRGQWKRQREGEGEDQHSSKRRKSLDTEDNQYVEIVVDREGDSHAIENTAEYGSAEDDKALTTEFPFYGLLDEQEQEYFKQADSILEIDDFTDPADRSLFLENIYAEAHGKELKIVSSQSCSRLMERLIAASSGVQLKGLWSKLSGHFLHLFQHRFASHCCESLFRHTAPSIREEILRPAQEAKGSETDGATESSMESLFLSCVDELRGNIGYLVTDRFASHPLRVLLIILSGIPLTNLDNRSLLQSKKKEKPVDQIAAAGATNAHSSLVPSSFHEAANEIMAEFTASLDSAAIRTLATHPVANPVLQILLIISATNYASKQEIAKDRDSMFRKILPDEEPRDGTESAGFINHLMYEPVGSRLLEVLVSHAPAKTFKTLFRSILRDRLSSMARNDIASFVLIKVLERLGKDDLEAASVNICKDLELLLKRSKHSVVRTLIDRCRIRGVSENHIADAVRRVYGDDDATRLDRMLSSEDAASQSSEYLKESEAGEGVRGLPLSRSSRKKSLDNQTHASLLVQSMLSVNGPLRTLITDSILALDPSGLDRFCKSRVNSPIIQIALTQPPDQPASFRRQLIPRFGKDPHSIDFDTPNKTTKYDLKETDENPDENREYLPFVDLATHPIGSHILDAIWTATSGSSSPSLPSKSSHGIGSRFSSNDISSGNSNTPDSRKLTFLRELIAVNLMYEERRLKESKPGRIVWRKWKMDLFRQADLRAWHRAADLDGRLPAQNSTFHSTSDSRGRLAATPTGNKPSNNNDIPPPPVQAEKSKIALARERFAKKRKEVEMKEAKSRRRQQQQQQVDRHEAFS